MKDAEVAVVTVGGHDRRRYGRGGRGAGARHPRRTCKAPCNPALPGGEARQGVERRPSLLAAWTAASPSAGSAGRMYVRDASGVAGAADMGRFSAIGRPRQARIISVADFASAIDRLESVKDKPGVYDTLWFMKD